MASRGELHYDDEWEYNEGGEESELLKTGGEEEVGRLKRNEGWHSCGKLQKDANYHQRYIPLKDVFGFRDLSSEDREKIVNDKRLTEEDKLFLESEKALKGLERLSDSVVCVKVKSHCGTGFYVRMDQLKDYEGDIVLTNSHTIRKLGSGNGSNFETVKPGDVKVYSFYNGIEQGSHVPREVIRIGNVSPPDLNKDKDILLRKTKTALQGAGSPPSETDTELISILDQLAPVLAAPEAFLDYAILFLKPLDKEDEKRKFAKVRPLEIKAFKPTAQEEIRNVSYFEISHPEMSTFPRSLRLFTISHPHCSSQQLSFGAMESCLFHVYLLNLVYGQNDTAYLEFLEGKDPFVDHSIATCPGSSGAPIFMYFINHETGEVEIEEVVYFLHFYEMRSELYGKAMSFATVLLQFDFHMPKSVVQKTGVQDQQKEETNTPRPLKDLAKVPAYLKILQDKKN